MSKHKANRPDSVLNGHLTTGQPSVRSATPPIDELVGGNRAATADLSQAVAEDESDLDIQTRAYVALKRAREENDAFLAAGGRASSQEGKRLEQASEQAFEALNDAAFEEHHTFDGVPTEFWGYRPRTRLKRGYELANSAILSDLVPEGEMMVFGTWGEYGVPHVWLELADGRIWEPVSGTLEDAAAQIERHQLQEYTHVPKSRYTNREAASAIVRYKVHGDYATWDATTGLAQN